MTMATTQLACEPKCPQPVASSTTEPCVLACPDSRVIIFPPPVVVTFPGPILTTCPQDTVVGASEPAGVAPAEPPELPARPEDKAPLPLRAEPRCGPKYSYSYSSQWTHPCNSYRAGKRWTC